ncbi:MAG: hypothetical protein H7Z74_07965 [Anaerolineae bacterium]|nr:hypothetical protein [Gemmatimonadaceae bacterium]
MRKLSLAAVIVAVVAFSACKKTGEGEYEVQKPVVGTTTDTVQTPTIEVGKDTTMVVTPDVDVKTPSERKKP